MNGESILQLQSASPPFVRFVLTTGVFILGRSSQCEFVAKDATISRRHAEITMDNGCVTVQDLNSRNGTYLDDRRIDTSPVHEGQRLRFGSVPFLVAPVSLDEPNSELETANCGDSKTLDLGLAELSLSEAQRRVFGLLFEGLPQKQIARRLNLSVPTVHNHIQAIYGILKVHSRAELLVRFMRKN